MGEVISKIFFFIVVLPYLTLLDGHKRLNKILKQHGYKELDLLYVFLFLLILLAVILYANGFR